MAASAWRIEGRVQGVGFRYATVRMARTLGLCGRVWNREDGTVEVHASGPADALDELGAWLEQGPPAARVEAVRSIQPGPPAHREGFRAEL